MNASSLARLAVLALLAGAAGGALAADAPQEELRNITRLSVTGAVTSDDHRDGEIRVILNSILPNFMGYQVRVDDGDWKSSEKTFVWTLRPGKNRLEARAVSKSGFEGPASTIELE